VKPGRLLPPDSGGKLRTYNILRQLSTRHEVTYLSYYRGKKDQDYEREILRIFPKAIPIATYQSEFGGLGRYFDYPINLFRSAPYAVSKFAARPVRTSLKKLLNPKEFDVAICDFLASTPNFPTHLPIPTVLFQHNVETILWQRRAALAERLITRTVSAFEARKMTRYEGSQLRRFHHVIAVSEQDRAAMAQVIDSSRISVAPTGVDLAEYNYDPNSRQLGPLVAFTGSMDWEPNIDGVEYFCREIWPLVLAQVPDARFRIVGRNPSHRVTSLRSGSVEVTGSVSSIRDHLREATVIVVPLRMGGGTRIKIYEGMAMGKATVSTSVGAEGLDVVHQRDILLADEPAAFAHHVVELLSQETLRSDYEAAAAATAKKYDWSVVVRRFEEIRETVAQNHTSTGECDKSSRLPILASRPVERSSGN